VFWPLCGGEHVPAASINASDPRQAEIRLTLKLNEIIEDVNYSNEIDLCLHHAGRFQPTLANRATRLSAREKRC
jgi:hypothetical protein